MNSVSSSVDEITMRRKKCHFLVIFSSALQVWLLLEEKRMPYHIDKVNMR